MSQKSFKNFPSFAKISVAKINVAKINGFRVVSILTTEAMLRAKDKFWTFKFNFFKRKTTTTK